MFEIDSGVPIPGGGGKAIYPWTTMESGDSFRVPQREDETLVQLRNRVNNAARSWVGRNRPGWSVVLRSEGDGIRVWIGTSEDLDSLREKP